MPSQPGMPQDPNSPGSDIKEEHSSESLGHTKLDEQSPPHPSAIYADLQKASSMAASVSAGSMMAVHGMMGGHHNHAVGHMGHHLSNTTAVVNPAVNHMLQEYQTL